MRFPYHCGILVMDLEEAIGRFQAIYGVRFREPESRALAPAPQFESAIPSGAEVRFSFSVGESYPYLELIEAQDSGIFDRAQGEGLHHVGFWVPDMDAVKAAQSRRGMELEASFREEDGSERVFYMRRGPLRVESVNGALRPGYEDWLAAGEAWER